MSVVAIPALILASISFYAGLYHLLIYSRHPEDKKNLSFALTCLAVGLYDVFAAGVYNATSVRMASPWQRGEVIAMMLFGSALVWFVADYTDQHPRKLLILFTGYFLMAAFVHLVDRSELTWLSLDTPSIKEILLPNGFEVTYYEMTPGPFTNFQSLFSLSIFIFIAGMAVRYFRQGNRRDALPLLVALAFFWVGIFNDTFVSSGLYRFIYLLEYAFMAVIFLMANSLAHQVAQVAVALRESESRYRVLFESSPISLWEENISGVKQYVDDLRASGISDLRAYVTDHPEAVANYMAAIDVLDVNQTTLKMFKAADKSQILQGLHVIMGEEAFPMLREELLALAEGNVEYRGEELYRTLTGDRLHGFVTLSIAPGFEDTWAKVFVSVVDITDRKQAEEALAVEKAYFEQLFQSAPEGIVVVNPDGAVLRINREFTRLFGHSLDEVLGRSIDTLLAPGSFLDEAASITKRVANGERVALETLRQHKNGSLIHVSILGAPILVGGEQVAVYGIYRDITERKRIEEELNLHRGHLEELVEERTIELLAKNEQLEFLGHIKDEFVSNVSHELRTPITNLKIHHRLLEGRPDKFNTYLETLQRETSRLERIIEDLLFLSRLDQARVEMNLTLVDLNALARQFTNDRQLLAESLGLKLTSDLQPDLPSVWADEGLLGQVLSTLLTNAFNFSPTGGQIEVDTHLRQLYGKEWVGFSVSDTGPGISSDDQQRLFERFFRGQAGRESGTSGTGLGLAIAKEIVDRHHGELEVESEGLPGKGTTLTVWLPVTDP